MSVWLEAHLAFNFFFLILGFGKAWIVARWADTMFGKGCSVEQSEVFCSAPVPSLSSVSMKPIEVCPSFHCSGISPLGHKDSATQEVPPSPQGSLSASWGAESVAVSYLLGHISSSCALGCCYKRQLKIIVLICVPGASEVKTWQYTFDLELLCNLNLFHLLPLLNYQKNDYDLQRYTTVWIWVCGNDMVYLRAIMNPYNDRITHFEHSHVLEKLLS